MRLFRSFFAALFLSAILPLALSAAGVVQSDICVYGGTSGGVIAAVAAARLGKSVTLVVVSNHVGGMTAGGLGVTDVGNSATIGGIANEFYLRVGQAYGSTSPVYWFEPHVAEQTFLQMLNGAGVPIYTNQQLASVTMSNQVITQITMADGTIYRAREFIDTTYEGDLMAMAGVTFIVGREGTSVYGESLAGIQTPGYSYQYDPYVIAGNSNSGLLPFVQSGSAGAVGQGDSKVQCYNFRLCLTQNTTNQIPVTAPANYSEAEYALFTRYIASVVATSGSVTLEQLINVQTLIPNGKTDINADGELSTDYIGYNFTYPTNTYAGRQPIYQAHKDYIAGLLYYLGHSTNVPANVRSDMLSWGYAKDEFQDNGGWPYALYVREARRMVSDYVMQQQDALGSRAATDVVTLASYTLDCHPVARLAVSGLTMEEGGIGVSVQYPYPVSYRSIIPRLGQCQNLFCTFALSASHVGFASIRLEPPFMMLSQAAGTAAAFAIDDNVSAQQLNYPKLAAELLADNQILNWSSGQSTSTNGIILVQNNTVGVTASSGWTVGANTGGWPLPNGPYWHDGATGKGSKWVTYAPNLPTNGYYDVYLWWVSDSNRSTNTPVDIVNATNSTRVFVNQRNNGSTWVKVASSNYFNAGSSGSVTIRNDGTAAGTYVIANAVRWMPLSFTLPSQSNAPPMVEVVASDAAAGEFGPNTARFSIVCVSGTNASPLTVNYTVGGTAVAGVDYTALSGSATIPAGAASATNILVVPLGDNLYANTETVTLTLTPSANYTLTNLSSATVTLHDRPLDVWRRANFTVSELANSQISGDNADPENDGLPNLIKYALGLSPKTAYTNVFNPGVQGGYFTLTYPQATAAVDVTIALQYSTDLKNWQSGPAYFQQTGSVNLGGTNLVTMQAATPVNAAARAYVRMQATKL